MKTQKTWSTPITSEKSALVPCALCGKEDFKPYLSGNGFSYVRCLSCNLVQINPQPEQSAVHKRYAGDGYFNYELSNERAFFRLGKLTLYDANISELEKFADQIGNRRVLEIGSATGSLLEFLVWRGWEAQGVEISEKEAEYARTKRALSVSSFPLEENNFPDNYFSLVIAFHLIEHLNNPAAFLREVKRVLAPGGRFLVTTPNVDGFQAHLFGNKWRSAIFDHLYLFSKETLSQFLLNEGFSLEKIVTWGGIAEGCAARPIKRAIDWAAKLFGFGDVMMIRAVKKE
ncbi:MAG: class I SAM-dependent methyltransferase [Spirochaetaceae bacterium]|nr:class I SAM-dependent methyltransferase [Spirochaetaceae bacterium]